MEIATISLDPHMLWNLVLTVIVIPAGWIIRSIFAEQKRIDILINKTREEIAKDYVTREQMEQTFQRIIDSIERIDEKIDRLQTKTYFQD
jgi:low affinity Fe/Cu permease